MSSLVSRVVTGTRAIDSLAGTSLDAFENNTVSGPRFADQALPLPADNAVETGRRLRVGLRPLDIDVIADESGAGASAGAGVRADAGAGASTADHGAAAGTLKGTVEFVENTGAESHVHARFGDTVLRAVSPQRLRLARGVTVTFRIDPSRMHLFDASTERRVA